MRLAKSISIAALLLAFPPNLSEARAQAPGAESPQAAAKADLSSAKDTQRSPRTLPFWAYPVLPSGVSPPPATADDGKPRHLPGTNLAFTITEIADRFDVADWFPETHPEMPDVVKYGDKAAAVQGCGFCHLPNGQGHPQNASLAGLPENYLEEQIADFRNGLRKSSEPRFAAVTQMIQIAKGLNDAETKSASQYFASMKYKPWIRVAQTKAVPKTISTGSMLLPAGGDLTESIGNRIIEVPEHPDRTELRDPTSGFAAYVPEGSILEGKRLVESGAGGKTIPCATCHGPELKGAANIPSISGRSPSQMARQLIDIQTGARNGASSQLMKPVVSKLDDQDIVDIAAYLASRRP
jgi:cytochrome c553